MGSFKFIEKVIEKFIEKVIEITDCFSILLPVKRRFFFFNRLIFVLMGLFDLLFKDFIFAYIVTKTH